MSRKDSLDWRAVRYDRPLERSTCVVCPFQSRQRWVEAKHRWPELLAEAVEIDANMRGGVAFAREPCLHPLGVLLAGAVRQDEADHASGPIRETASGTGGGGIAASQWAGPLTLPR